VWGRCVTTNRCGLLAHAGLHYWDSEGRNYTWDHPPMDEKYPKYRRDLKEFVQYLEDNRAALPRSIIWKTTSPQFFPTPNGMFKDGILDKEKGLVPECQAIELYEQGNWEVGGALMPLLRTILWNRNWHKIFGTGIGASNRGLMRSVRCVVPHTQVVHGGDFNLAAEPIIKAAGIPYMNTFNASVLLWRYNIHAGDCTHFCGGSAYEVRCDLLACRCGLSADHCNVSGLCTVAKSCTHRPSSMGQVWLYMLSDFLEEHNLANPRPDAITEGYNRAEHPAVSRLPGSLAWMELPYLSAGLGASLVQLVVAITFVVAAAGGYLHLRSPGAAVHSNRLESVSRT
jgi:hypothetical protein